MAKIVIKSRVGADGVLHFDLPLGSPEAGREVQVTVESAPSGAVTQAEWAAFLDRTAGAWLGEFELPRPLEQRDARAISNHLPATATTRPGGATACSQG